MRYSVWYYRRLGIKIEGAITYICPDVYFDSADYSAITIQTGVTISREVLFLVHDYSVHTAMVNVGWNAPKGKTAHFIKPIDQLETLKRRLNESGLNVTESSTVITDAVWKFQRKKVLQKKWNEFSSVQLVVTDRLHGMVFSAITGTPCIALDNISHKVYGAYQWLSYLPYLRFCSSIDEVEDAAKELLKLPPQNYDLKPLLPYYNEMRNVVKNAIENVEQVTNGD